MAVHTGRGTVGGPTSVGNTNMCVKDSCEVRLLLFNQDLQLGHLADFFECKDLIPLVTVNRQTS
jgi:MinD-like ATPase involved in chromosome partitioning or flagellar assembly